MKKPIRSTIILIIIIGLFSVFGDALLKEKLTQPGNPYDLVVSLDAKFVEWYPCIAGNQNDHEAFDPVSSFRQSELERVAVCGLLTTTHDTATAIWWNFDNNDLPFATSSNAMDLRFEAGFHSFALVDSLQLSRDLPGYREIQSQLSTGQLPTGWYRVDAYAGRNAIGSVSFEVTP
ncbi:MAG: hypothetical protein DWQ07_12055 [Chloroflexi bacterium]|nr:MAG: hypothetical protein DWQ07_12055 [Chloroflexota bacterium]MBL1196092.1 hypothetical protein [Chloroflexota bacterium]NOH13385.1 hypothetical protein [Chloroflexota bacterium]